MLFKKKKEKYTGVDWKKISCSFFFGRRKKYVLGGIWRDFLFYFFYVFFFYIIFVLFLDVGIFGYN